MTCYVVMRILGNGERVVLRSDFARYIDAKQYYDTEAGRFVDLEHRIYKRTYSDELVCARRFSQ